MQTKLKSPLWFGYADSSFGYADPRLGNLESPKAPIIRRNSFNYYVYLNIRFNFIAFCYFIWF